MSKICQLKIKLEVMHELHKMQFHQQWLVDLSKFPTNA